MGASASEPRSAAARSTTATSALLAVIAVLLMAVQGQAAVNDAPILDPMVKKEHLHKRHRRGGDLDRRLA
jgi:hypothetical protein